jgi:hypothetical protein
VRNTLLSALETWADPSQRHKTHQFLTGLSCDELQYIADFIGASLLETLGGCESRAQLAALVAEFQRAKCCPGPRGDDEECKAILLLEYLCRGGGRRLQTATAGRA